MFLWWFTGQAQPFTEGITCIRITPITPLRKGKTTNINQKAAVLGAALLLTMTACSAGNTTTPPAPASTTAAPAPTQDTAQFGGSVTFPTGVKVTVSQPQAVPTGPYAAGALEGKAVVFTLSVTNGSKGPVNGSMMGYPKVSYGADGTQAETVFDTAQGINAGHLSTILPGETQTVKLGFAVPSSGYPALRVEVHGPNLTEQPAIFKGAVG